MQFRQLPHNFAGKSVLNVLAGFYQSEICRFRAMTLSPLHLLVNWPVFTIYCVKIWRHLQNQKYITYCVIVRGGPSHRHICTESSVMFGHVIFDIYERTGGQTYRHADDNTLYSYRGWINHTVLGNAHTFATSHWNQWLVVNDLQKCY